MKTKQIVFTEKNKAELLEKELSEIKEGYVRVRLSRSSISSGTERANLTGELNIKANGYLTEVKFPRYGGYSSAGTVIEVGEGVTEYKAGDRVALSWSQHSLFCDKGRSSVHRLPDNVSFADGALVHIATFPLAAIRKCRLEIGESAIVMGLGVLGLIAVGLLKAGGACPVIAVDPDPRKREKALSGGADFALDPFEDGFAERVKEICGGANVAIEVTGNGKALDQVLDCMAMFGRVALLGCTRNSDFSIDYYHKVHAPGITLVGAHTMARPKNDSSAGLWTENDDADAVIKLISAGRLSLSSLVDEVHSPLEAPEVYTRLATEKTFPVVQFDWDKT